MAPIRKLRRVRNSMQVSPRAVAVISIISPIIPVNKKVMVVKRIKIGIEIFV